MNAIKIPSRGEIAIRHVKSMVHCRALEKDYLPDPITTDPPCCLLTIHMLTNSSTFIATCLQLVQLAVVGLVTLVVAVSLSRALDCGTGAKAVRAMLQPSEHR